MFLVILGILSGIGYWAYNNFASPPSLKTKDAAKSIPKYTSVQEWTIKDHKSLCVSKTDCNPPIIITFTSSTGWSEIYSFYINSMKAKGWSTNSSVITSTPTNVLFAQDECDASLIKSQDSNKITITVTCKQ